jgi:site-specific recombinase
VSVTIFAHGKKFESLSASFYIGLVVAIAGMLLVMFNKPNEIKASAQPVAAFAATAGGGSTTPQ